MNNRSNAVILDATDADLLVASVMATVRNTAQDRRWAFSRIAFRAVGVVAVLALAIGGLLALNLPRSNVAAPVAPTTKFHEAGLMFDYPAAWTFSSSQALTSGGLAPAFFLGSVRASATCVPASGGAIECATFLASLAPNTVAVKVAIDGSTPWMQHDIREGTGRTVVIGGLPALTGPSQLVASRMGADRVTTWIVTSLQDVNRHYVITVAMRGPDLAGLQTQVDALLASVSFDPPPQP